VAVEQELPALLPLRGGEGVRRRLGGLARHGWRQEKAQCADENWRKSHGKLCVGKVSPNDTA
jgi:hypothetical protein